MRKLAIAALALCIFGSHAYAHPERLKASPAEFLPSDDDDDDDDSNSQPNWRQKSLQRMQQGFGSGKKAFDSCVRSCEKKIGQAGFNYGKCTNYCSRTYLDD